VTAGDPATLQVNTLQRPQLSLAALLLSQLPAFSEASLYEDNKAILDGWGAASLSTMCYSSDLHTMSPETVQANCAVQTTVEDGSYTAAVDGNDPALILAETINGDIVGAYISFGLPADWSGWLGQKYLTCLLPGEIGYPSTEECIEGGSFLFGMNAVTGNSRSPVYSYPQYAYFGNANNYAAFGGAHDLLYSPSSDGGIQIQYAQVGYTYLCGNHDAGYIQYPCPDEYLLGTTTEPVPLTKFEVWNGAIAQPSLPPSAPLPSTPPSTPPLDAAAACDMPATYFGLNSYAFLESSPFLTALCLLHYEGISHWLS